MAEIIKNCNLLLTEGHDEKHFFEALAMHLGISDQLQIISYEGKTLLEDRISAIYEASKKDESIDIKIIGITRDSDNDPNASFESVKSSLGACGLPVPEKPLEIKDGNPKTIVIILPDKDKKGMIEDLCLEAVSEDPALECVDKYFECLKANQIEQPRIMQKARVQAYLAAKKESYIKLGVAALKGYWPLDSPVFGNAVNFIGQIIEQ